MRISFKAVIVLAVSAAICGCSNYELVRRTPPVVPTKTASRSEAPYLEKTAVAGPEQAQAQSAVDASLEWAKKHAQVSEQLVEAQKENRQRENENRELNKQTAELQSELSQTQKELTQANDMLVELGQQLEKWKADVLGFREEMRQAEKSQLEALSKVLRLLGGEVSEPVATTAGATAPASKEVPSASGK